MRIKAVALLAVMFASAGVVTGGGDKAKGDLKKFEGTWSVATAQKGGKDAPEGEIKEIQLVFSGEKLTFKHGEKAIEGTFKIDPSKKPKQIDVSLMGKDVEGIYRFKKDGKLELCISDAGRPTEFKSPDDSPTMLIVLKREKP
jgi:uncharacterized protein (TIGR03067 family)